MMCVNRKLAGIDDKRGFLEEAPLVVIDAIKYFLPFLEIPPEFMT